MGSMEAEADDGRGGREKLSERLRTRKAHVLDPGVAAPSTLSTGVTLVYTSGVGLKGGCAGVPVGDTWGAS